VLYGVVMTCTSYLPSTGSWLLLQQELEEKDLEIEFYKEQEHVHQEEILAYKRVEASVLIIT